LPFHRPALLTARSLKRQLESKWKTLDNFENSVKKLDITRLQWKQKYAMKQGELEAAKVSRPYPLYGRSPDSSRAIPSYRSSSPLSKLAPRHPILLRSARSLNGHYRRKNAPLAQTTSSASSKQNLQNCKAEQDRRKINGQQGSKSTRTGLESRERRLRRKSRAERNEQGSWRIKFGESSFLSNCETKGKGCELIEGSWKGRWTERGAEVEG
jgi:hypothetical protein